MSHAQLLRDGLPWGLEAQKIINHAIGTALPEDIDTEIAAAIAALKAASNVWSNTNNFTGTVQLAGVGLLAGLRGHIAGLTLSNNGTDATNDIDIAVGAAVASDQSALLVLSSALTKQLDAVWAAGTNAGMRASGAAIADTTYHIFLIRRPDTGVVDIAADTSSTGANIAANTNAAYTQKRRIGSIIRASAAIVAFSQNGDEFLRLALATSVNANNPGTSAVLGTMAVPVGIKVDAIFSFHFLDDATNYLLITSPDQTDVAADASHLSAVITAGSERVSGQQRVRTNTSAQVRYRVNVSDASVFVQFFTFGWVDRRGRDD